MNPPEWRVFYRLKKVDSQNLSLISNKNLGTCQTGHTGAMKHLFPGTEAVDPPACVVFLFFPVSLTRVLAISFIQCFFYIYLVVVDECLWKTLSTEKNITNSMICETFCLCKPGTLLAG